MKNSLLICFFCVIAGQNCQGQWIQQLWTNPSFLTTNTPVQLIAEVDFPSGDCKDKTLNVFQAGNSISAYAIHCLGVLSFICNDKDTFNIGLLPAGTYTFYYQVDAGMSPSPCTPGIVPGPSDSLTFVVNSASGSMELEKEIFDLFPNPASSMLHLILNGNLTDGSYRIMNNIGALVQESFVKGDNMQIDISQLADGLYTFIYEDVAKNISIKKFAKK
ncbi:MAG: T9SS type A sorting domain-containing protein [Bacteroidetes bacterium]|nr:T9SS type A sorting domain-containing protein [Bacteroidota bacterium]